VPETTTSQELVPTDRLGPALVEATGDERWTQVHPELISGGKSNLTFLLTSPAGEMVLRRPPTGDLLPSAHDRPPSPTPRCPPPRSCWPTPGT